MKKSVNLLAIGIAAIFVLLISVGVIVKANAASQQTERLPVSVTQQKLSAFLEDTTLVSSKLNSPSIYWNGSLDKNYGFTSEECVGREIATGCTSVSYSGATGGTGFAHFLGCHLFGTSPEPYPISAGMVDGASDQGWILVSDIARFISGVRTLEPGDILHANGHAAVVLSATNDKVTVLQVVSSSNCKFSVSAFYVGQGIESPQAVLQLIENSRDGWIWLHPTETTSDADTHEARATDVSSAEQNEATAGQFPLEGTVTYTIQPYDTLWALACRFLGDGYRYKEIAELNGISEGGIIYFGRDILIPSDFPASQEEKPEKEKAYADDQLPPEDEWANQPAESPENPADGPIDAGELPIDIVID
jgi:hypothetical protein